MVLRCVGSLKLDHWAFVPHHVWTDPATGLVVRIWRPFSGLHFDVLQEPANSTTHRQLNLAITGFMFLLFMTKIHWSCLRGLQTLRQLRFCLLSTS